MLFLEKYKALFIVLISVFLYFAFAYSLERTAFNTLSFLWCALFAGFYLLLQQKNTTFSTLAIVAILFRFIFLFSTPQFIAGFFIALSGMDACSLMASIHIFTYQKT